MKINERNFNYYSKTVIQIRNEMLNKKKDEDIYNVFKYMSQMY